MPRLRLRLKRFALQHGGSAADAQGIRLPAGEVEAAVADEIAEALRDPLALAAKA